MNDSILDSVKKLLGIGNDYDVFDTDIIILINGVFMTLNQIGIGPEDGFSISDNTSTWSEFMTNPKNIEAVKTYTWLQVKLAFDPPSSSSVIESINKTCNELIWRLNVQVDP